MVRGRRRFLSLATGGGLLALSVSGRKLLVEMLNSHNESCSEWHTLSGTEPLQIVKETSWALGSDVSIVALHKDRYAARQAISAAFAELELVEEVMSLYREESQLCRLNRCGSLQSPHPYLVEVLNAARQMSQGTHGAFDITVQPLWEIYAKAEKENVQVDTEQLKEVRAHVDYRRVVIGDQGIRLLDEGTKITLNGIAQGFASDRATTVLRSYGIKHAMIDTGELSALGKREGSADWQIGIQHPRHEDAYVSVADLSGRCLATSGDYATKFSADYSQHHLLDPRSGKSPTQLSSVSVAAPTAMQADAISTAVFVLGAERGSRLVQSIPGADCLLVHKNGRVRKSAGFPSRI